MAISRLEYRGYGSARAIAKAVAKNGWQYPMALRLSSRASTSAASSQVLRSEDHHFFKKWRIFALLFLKKSCKDYIIIINIRSVRPSSLQVATGRWTAYLEVVGSVLFAAAAGTDSHPSTSRVTREIAELAGWLCLLRLLCSSASGLVHALRRWRGPSAATSLSASLSCPQNNSERWVDVGRSGHATRETRASRQHNSQLTDRRMWMHPGWSRPGDFRSCSRCTFRQNFIIGFSQLADRAQGIWHGRPRGGHVGSAHVRHIGIWPRAGVGTCRAGHRCREQRQRPASLTRNSERWMDNVAMC